MSTRTGSGRFPFSSFFVSVDSHFRLCSHHPTSSQTKPDENPGDDSLIGAPAHQFPTSGVSPSARTSPAFGQTSSVVRSSSASFNNNSLHVIPASGPLLPNLFHSLHSSPNGTCLDPNKRTVQTSSPICHISLFFFSPQCLHQPVEPRRPPYRTPSIHIPIKVSLPSPISWPCTSDSLSSFWSTPSRDTMGVGRQPREAGWAG